MPEIVIEYSDPELDAFIQRQILISPGRGHLRRGYKIQLPDQSSVKVYQDLINAGENSRAFRPENIGSINETFQEHSPETIAEFRAAHFALHTDRRNHAQNLIVARLQFQNQKVQTILNVPDIPIKREMTVLGAELEVLGRHLDEGTFENLSSGLLHDLRRSGYHIHLRSSTSNTLSGLRLRVNSCTPGAAIQSEEVGGEIITDSDEGPPQPENVHPIIIEFVNDVIGGDSFLGKTIEIRILQDIATRSGLTYNPPTNEQESNNIDGAVGESLYSVKPATWRGWNGSALNMVGEVNFVGYHIEHFEPGSLRIVYQDDVHVAMELYGR